MKKFALLVAINLIFSSYDSFGQVYEKIYALSGPEVQNKIDENKIAGVNILSGIKTHHIIGISGIGITNKEVLENLLNNEPKIISFTLNDDMSSILIDSEATLTKEEFAQLLLPINGIITGYIAEYSVNPQ